MSRACRAPGSNTVRWDIFCERPEGHEDAHGKRMPSTLTTPSGWLYWAFLPGGGLMERRVPDDIEGSEGL